MRKPSPSVIISTLALVVSATGGATAATMLAPHSVGWQSLSRSVQARILNDRGPQGPQGATGAPGQPGAGIQVAKAGDLCGAAQGIMLIPPSGVVYVVCGGPGSVSP